MMAGLPMRRSKYMDIKISTILREMVRDCNGRHIRACPIPSSPSEVGPGTRTGDVGEAVNKAHLGQQQILDELLRDGGAAAALAERRDCTSQAAYVVALMVEEPVVLGRHHRLRLILPLV
jgi:hypothetical protein